MAVEQQTPACHPTVKRGDEAGKYWWVGDDDGSRVFLVQVIDGLPRAGGITKDHSSKTPADSGVGAEGLTAKDPRKIFGPARIGRPRNK